MNQVTVIEAKPRERLGTGGARAARRAGNIPAIVYGGSTQPLEVEFVGAVLAREINRAGFFRRLIDLKVGAETVRVLPRDVQYHPVTDAPLHVDFQRLGPDAVVRVMVPVVFLDQDKSPGLRRGGVLNVVRHEVEVICPAVAIPPSFQASVAGLEIGSSIHISAIALPDGVHPTIRDRDFTIASIAAPTVMKAETAAPAAGEAAAAGAAPAATPETKS